MRKNVAGEILAEHHASRAHHDDFDHARTPDYLSEREFSIRRDVRHPDKTDGKALRMKSTSKERTWRASLLRRRESREFRFSKNRGGRGLPPSKARVALNCLSRALR